MTDRELLLALRERLLEMRASLDSTLDIFEFMDSERDDQPLPVKDAAALMGVSVHSLRRNLKSGRVKGENLGMGTGKGWRVTPNAVLNGINAGFLVREADKADNVKVPF